MAVLSWLDGHSEQRRQAIDHGRILVGDLTVHLDHRLVDVADQYPALAVQDVAPWSRGVDRFQPVAGGHGLGGRGVEHLEEPQAGEERREQAAHHDQQDRQPHLR